MLCVALSWKLDTGLKTNLGCPNLYLTTETHHLTFFLMWLNEFSCVIINLRVFGEKK